MGLETYLRHGSLLANPIAEVQHPVTLGDYVGASSKCWLS